MIKRSFGIVVVLIATLVLVLPLSGQDTTPTPEAVSPTLLTDPFLQLPTEDAVHVVWFTEFEGTNHRVVWGENLDQEADATTTKMSRLAEDPNSRVGEQTENGQVYTAYTPRDVWRHEAVASGLTQGERTPYYVTSTADDATVIESERFTLQPLPAPGQPLQILLTSDNQLMPMTPTNMQKVIEFIGEGEIDAVLMAGDLQNIPDRASEWFDDNRGRAFFPALQGRSSAVLERTFAGDGYTAVTTATYTGGPIIQHAPLFPAVGNHEVMGRYNPGYDTGYQYNDPQPRAVAEARYEQVADLVNPNGDPAIRDQWIEDNSWNITTYEELFTLPDDSPGGEAYYAMQYGDVYVISLFSTRIWRTPGLGDDARGKYRERLRDLNNPTEWGYGDFIFEDLQEGSEQYNWLVEQLASEAFQNARYKVVLLHQGPHGLGDNYNPVLAHPVQVIDRDEQGRIIAVRYEYPIEDDIVFRDVMPLLEEAGVHLMHQGHSHLWFRLQTPGGINIMETSNVGNNYGCYLEGYRERGNVPNDARFNAANYAAVGDPHGLEPIMPSEFAPMSYENGDPLPCIASNDLTTFSIFDTETGIISSYVFDARQPDSEIRLFDQFNVTEGQDNS
ncbi:MAG: metallophosphoesterase [bacterium]|nr:metallophosphoesterase [bacterium]